MDGGRIAAGRRAIFAALFLVALAASPLLTDASAQRPRPATGSEAGLLRELDGLTTWLGMIVGEARGAVGIALTVKEVEGVDLRPGDFVRGVDGERIRDVADLREAYSAVAVSDTVTLLVRREGDDVTLRFAKPDPATVPDVRMQIIDPDEPELSPRGAERSGLHRRAPPESGIGRRTLGGRALTWRRTADRCS